MSHWRHTMVDGTKFWISYQWLAFLSIFSRWQLIQNLAPSTIVWHQCDIWMSQRLVFEPVAYAIYTPNKGASNQTITNNYRDLPWTSQWKISPSTVTSINPTLLCLHDTGAEWWSRSKCWVDVQLEYESLRYLWIPLVYYWLEGTNEDHIMSETQNSPHTFEIPNCLIAFSIIHFYFLLEVCR